MNDCLWPTDHTYIPNTPTLVGIHYLLVKLFRFYFMIKLFKEIKTQLVGIEEVYLDHGKSS